MAEVARLSINVDADTGKAAAKLLALDRIMRQVAGTSNETTAALNRQARAHETLSRSAGRSNSAISRMVGSSRSATSSNSSLAAALSRVTSSANASSAAHNRMASSYTRVNNSLNNTINTTNRASTSSRNLGNNSNSASNSLARMGGAGGNAGRQVSQGMNSAGRTSLRTKLILAAIPAVIMLLPAAASVAAAGIMAILPAAFIGIAALALKSNKQIKSGFDNMMTSITNTFAKAAQPMVQPLLDGMKQLAGWAKKLAPLFKQAFAAAAPAVKPLVDSIGLLVQHMLPGMITALNAAGPVLQGLKSMFTSLGDGISAFFANASKGAQGMKQAFIVLGNGIQQLLGTLGTFLGQIAGPGSIVLHGFLNLINSLVSGLTVGLVGAFQYLAQPLSNLLTAIGSLVGQVLGKLLPAIGQAAAIFAAGLTPVIKAITPILVQIAQIFGRVAVVLAEAVTPIVRAVGLALAQLMPPILGIVQALLNALIPVILQLSPIFVQIVNVLAQALTPVFKVIGQLIAALAPIVGRLLSALVGLAGTLVTALTPVLISLSHLLANVVGAVIKALIPVIGTLVNAFITIVQAIAPILPLLGKLVAQLLNALSPVLVIIVQALGQLLQAFLPIIPPIAQLIAVFAKLAIGILSVVLPPLIQLAGILLGAVGTALKFIIGVIAEVIKWMTTMLGAGITAGIGFFKNLGSVVTTVWNAIKSLTSTVWGAILGFLKATWNGMKTAWNATVGFIKSIWDTTSHALQAGWNAVWGAMKAFVTGIWNGIKGLATGFWNGLKSIFANSWNAIKNGWNAIWNAMKSIVTTIWTFIRNYATAWWNQLKGIFSSAWNAIKNGWNAIWNAMKSIVTTIWTFIRHYATAWWNQLKGIFSSAWNAIKNGWNAIWNAMKSFVTGVWTFLRHYASAWWDQLKGLFSAGGHWLLTTFWNPVKNFFTKTIPDAFAAAARALGKAWDSIKKLVRAPIQAVVNVVYNNGIVKLWNIIAGTFGAKKLKEFKLPAFASGGAVSGKGNGTSDSIPARLSHGEHVWTAKEVNAAGGHSAVAGLRAAALGKSSGSVRTMGSGGLYAKGGGAKDDDDGGILGSIGSAIGGAISGAIGGIGDFFDSIGSTLKGAFDAAVGFGAKVLKGVAELVLGGIHQIVNPLIDQVAKVGKAAVEKLIPGKPGMEDMAKGIIDKIAETVKKWITANDVIPGGLGFQPFRPWRKGDEQHVSWHGVTLNKRSAEMMDKAQGIYNDLGPGGHINAFQGSFSSGVAASAGTHSGGGAIDVGPANMSLVGAMRASGWAAWPRGSEFGSPSFSPHIHGIAVGDPTVSPAAAEQVQQFTNGQNGLANHGPDPYKPPKAYQKFVSKGSAQSVQNWRSLALKAMAMGGLSTSLIDGFLRLMAQESSGNPAAINGYDSNAQRGQASRGLMQVTPETFAYYHVAGTSNNIFDPLANMAAAAAYIVGRYGGGYIPNSPYKNGTSNATKGWHWVGENGPELRYFHGGEKVKSNRDSMRYMVKQGDTLWDIARQMYGDPTMWRRIYNANRGKINNPDLIYPGQHFRIPGAGGGGGNHHVYTVDAGAVSITIPGTITREALDELQPRLEESLKQAIMAGVGANN